MTNHPSLTIRGAFWPTDEPSDALPVTVTVDDTIIYIAAANGVQWRLTDLELDTLYDFCVSELARQEEEPTQ